MSAAKKPEELKPTRDMTLIIVSMVFIAGLAAMVIIGRSNFSLKHGDVEIGLIAAEKPLAPVVTPPTLTSTTP